MTTKKLSLDDFEAVAVSELLLVKGGANGHETPSYCPPTEDCDEGTSSGGGGCTEGGSKAGEPDGFGGTLDQDEVVVYGTDYSRPMIRQASGNTTTSSNLPCYACADAASPRPVTSPGIGTWFRDNFLHRTGCTGDGAW